MLLSVIICTHNPRPGYLERVIEALKRQSLPTSNWELIIVDNGSAPRVATLCDLSWHPHARITREGKLGLTHSRIHGIQHSTGDLIVFVDDDNCLSPSYLKQATTLANDYPWIGAFGGSCIGEFEKPLEKQFQFLLPKLAIRNITEPTWACQPGTKSLQSAPCGAGMVVRRAVATDYVDRVAGSYLRQSLDRRGSSLSSAGDSDLALCACALGFAVGRFPALTLTHLIPASAFTSHHPSSFSYVPFLPLLGQYPRLDTRD